jgi:glycosyltransferase involved in cell wall biosynthesis
MKLLCVSPRQAWPINSGAKLRDYHLARALSRMGELTYVFYQSPNAPPGDEGFSGFCKTLAVPAPHLYRPGNIILGSLGRWPLPILNYTSRQLVQQLETLLRTQHFDIIHVDSVHLSAVMETLRSACGRTRIFYNWHNIESELMKRYAHRAPSFLHRIYALRTMHGLSRAERLILQTAHGHIVCSEREREQLAKIAPWAKITTIENGVDTVRFQPSGDPHGRNRLVFVGAMGYHANVDGALYFSRELWPAIRARFPHLELMLVGADPTPAVQALGRLEGITVTGTVDDILPYYRRALAAIVPLRVGGGTRLKILEAMAAGVPVISTATGAEGLSISPGLDILLAETSEDWLSAVERISAPCAWGELARAGRQLVEVRYDWEKLGGLLVATYRGWAEESMA